MLVHMGSISIPQCTDVVNRNRQWSTSCITLMTVECVMAECTLVTVTKKLCGLNKQKLVAMATSLKRSQPNFAAIIHALKATNSENFAKIGRNNWAQTNSKNWKQFQLFGSSRVIKNGAIRQNTYDFLFNFQSNYVPMSLRFGDMA